MITGIGSLPRAGALDLVSLACPTLPFWPQDPSQTYGTMIGEVLGGFSSGLVPLDTGVTFEVVDPRSFVRLLREGVLPELSPPLARFKAALASGRFPRADGVKGQLVGPATLATCLLHQGAPLTRVVPEQELYAALGLRLSVLAANQVAALSVASTPVQVWIDEPCLPGSSPAALKAVATVLRAIREAGARSGLHCCAELPLDLVRDLAPQVVSFDAWNGLEGFCRHPLAPALVASSRRIAWGIIPTSSEELRTLEVTELVDRWLTAVTPLGDPKELRRRAVFTPACGLGPLPHLDALRAFALLAEFDDRLRDACEG